MKRVIILGCIVGASTCSANTVHQEAWTWLYQKKFNAQELEDAKNKHNFVFLKHDLPQFTQLMFSWNAFRPAEGYFTFYVQVRNAKNQTWGQWHKMAAWGAKMQRSFGSVAESTVKYLNVRLEARAGHEADAFRIRVQAEDGADLSKFRSFAVSLSNFHKFKTSLVDNTICALPSTHVSNVPKQSQFKVPYERNDSICSPTSVGMLIGSLTHEKIDYCQLVRGSFDNGLRIHGSWPLNMAHAFEHCKGNVHFAVGRLHSFAQLHERLEKGIPVVVSVRGYLHGAPKVYEKGHLLVVVGWDSKRRQVICHDPAFKSNHKVLKRYAVASFLRAWDRSNRLAYLADPVRT